MENKMKSQLLVCDLDGTLLDEQGEIDFESLSLIKKFCEDGGHFVICTGRMDTDIKYVEEKLGFKSEYRISQNGAVIHDRENHLVKYETIPLEYIPTLSKIIFGMHLRTEVSNITNRLFPSPRDPKHVAEFVDSSIVIPELEKHVLDNEKNATIYLTFGNQEQFAEIRRKIEHALGQTAVNAVMTSPSSLEVFSRKTSKGQALAFILEKLSLNRKNIYVAGDAESDISMFPLTANSFAVQQADEETRRQASYYAENVGVIVKKMYEEVVGC